MANPNDIEVVNLTSSDGMYLPNSDQLEHVVGASFEQACDSTPTVFGNFGLCYNVFIFK